MSLLYKQLATQLGERVDCEVVWERFTGSG